MNLVCSSFPELLSKIDQYLVGLSSKLQNWTPLSNCLNRLNVVEQCQTLDHLRLFKSEQNATNTFFNPNFEKMPKTDFFQNAEICVLAEKSYSESFLETAHNRPICI